MIGRLVLVVAAALLVPTLALAADRGDIPAAPVYRADSWYPGQGIAPYPLSRRAAEIRAAERCWRACLVETGRDFQACLRVHRPTGCVGWNSGANLHCLHACRLGGGPWVNVVE